MSQPAFDFGDDELDDGANPTYTVGELAEAINSSFQRSFGDGIWVRGEITGWSDRGNHAYFSLADDASSASATAPSSTSSSSRRPGCGCGRCCRSIGCASPTA